MLGTRLVNHLTGPPPVGPQIRVNGGTPYSVTIPTSFAVGTSTFTVDAACSFAIYGAAGGGGGGQGIRYLGDGQAAGGGGGGGAAVYGMGLLCVPGRTYTVVVGVGGSAAAQVPTDPGDGGAGFTAGHGGNTTLVDSVAGTVLALGGGQGAWPGAVNGGVAGRATGGPGGVPSAGNHTAAGGAGGTGGVTGAGTGGASGSVIGTGPYGAPGGGGGGGKADMPAAGLAGGASPGFVPGGVGGAGGDGLNGPTAGQGGAPYWGASGTVVALPLDARYGGGSGGGGGGLALPGFAIYRGGGGGGAGGPSYGPSVGTSGSTLGGDGTYGGLSLTNIATIVIDGTSYPAIVGSQWVLSPPATHTVTVAGGAVPVNLAALGGGGSGGTDSTGQGAYGGGGAAYAPPQPFTFALGKTYTIKPGLGAPHTTMGSVVGGVAGVNSTVVNTTDGVTLLNAGAGGGGNNLWNTPGPAGFMVVGTGFAGQSGGAPSPPDGGAGGNSGAGSPGGVGGSGGATGGHGGDGGAGAGGGGGNGNGNLVGNDYYGGGGGNGYVIVAIR